MDKETFESLIGIKISVLIAGFVGAIVQLAHQPRLTFLGAAMSMFSGMACASFLTPLFSWFANVPAQAEYTIAFFLGLLGMQLTAKIYVWFYEIDLKIYLNTFFNRGGKKEK